MGGNAKLKIARLAPILFIVVAAFAYIASVEQDSDYLLWNGFPLGVVIALAWLTLHKGGGSWIGAGWRWPLGTLGFAIPALGLSLYLHYAYAMDLDGMVSEAERPQQLFRFLPYYTLVAGAIGFAIGWIVGRNV